MKFTILLTSLLYYQLAMAQNPETDTLPSKFDGLEQLIQVQHFPNPVYVSIEENEEGLFFWKHTTSLLSIKENIKVLEGGAFIYYNNQWYLRVAMGAKEFCKLYDIKNRIMKAGQPYTFKDN